MAQLVTANPKLFSKSPDQELSESVVKVSGNSKFTRLDVREQCPREKLKDVLWMGDLKASYLKHHLDCINIDNNSVVQWKVEIFHIFRQEGR